MDTGTFTSFALRYAFGQYVVGIPWSTDVVAPTAAWLHVLGPHHRYLADPSICVSAVRCLRLPLV
jgi:hypothetical protein